MKYVLSIAILFLTLSIAQAALMGVKVQIIEKQDGNWRYVVNEASKTLEFPSDAEMASYLKKLSNPGDSIWLTIDSGDRVPVDELIKVLTMIKANKEGIVVKKIVLDTKNGK